MHRLKTGKHVCTLLALYVDQEYVYFVESLMVTGMHYKPFVAIDSSRNYKLDENVLKIGK